MRPLTIWDGQIHTPDISFTDRVNLINVLAKAFLSSYIEVEHTQPPTRNLNMVETTEPSSKNLLWKTAFSAAAAALCSGIAFVVTEDPKITAAVAMGIYAIALEIFSSKGKYLVSENCPSDSPRPPSPLLAVFPTIEFAGIGGFIIPDPATSIALLAGSALCVIATTVEFISRSESKPVTKQPRLSL